MKIKMRRLFAPIILALRILYGVRLVVCEDRLLQQDSNYDERVMEEEAEQYCRICVTHTMCRYSIEDYGSDCSEVKEVNLDARETSEVLHLHNQIRSNIAEGKELRGNPGPQPAARNMLQMVWDEELANIARRWSMQCRLEESDFCRDVERFNVWQNVNVMKLKKIDEQTTSFTRLAKHIDTWLNEVNDFDAAKVGLIKLDNNAENYSAYVALASWKTHRLGCSRIVYKTMNTFVTKESQTVDPGERVEVFICNYGPMDRTVAEPLYEFGVPGFCPSGTVPSTEYRSLCLKSNSRRDVNPAGSQEGFDQQLGDSHSSTDACRISTSFILIRVLIQVLV